MAVKYTCPKCNRRFTEWGAEKYGFKCPNDEWRPKDHPDDVELVRLGPLDDRPTRRPTLKKGARKLAVSLPAGYGDEPAISDVGDLETAAEFGSTEANFDDAEAEEDDASDEDAATDAPAEGDAVEVSADVEIEGAIDLDETDTDDEEGDEVDGEKAEEDDWQEP